MLFVVAFLAICAATQAYVPLHNKIVGGYVVDISDAPYQVSVRIFDRHICGGSIINEDSVLTAAHCIYGVDPEIIGVRIGHIAHSIGQYITVTHAIAHKTYDPQILDKDLAVLKLANPIIFSATTQPIQLQPKGIDVPDDSIAWVSGWGYRSDDSQDKLDSLHGVDVRVTSFQECSYVYGNGKITSNMLCANNFLSGVCQGDCGGPLVFNGSLIGVVSWGYGCERPQYPQVYAKVSSLYDWIIEIAK